MNKLWITLLLSVLASVSFADVRLDLARKLISDQNAEFGEALKGINKQFEQKVNQETDPEKREALQAIFGNDAFKESDLREVTDALAKILAENMSETELEQAIAFQESPAGRKLQASMKDAKAQLMPVILQIVARKMQEAAQKMNR